jgi:hypothetical protein
MSLELSPLELGTLKRLYERLIPADDFPGAWESGALDFLEKLAATALPELPGRLKQGLAGLEAASLAKFKSGFASLSGQDADSLIAEENPFIQWMVELSAQGYYADPEAGGNRGGMSWKMLGYKRRRN